MRCGIRYSRFWWLLSLVFLWGAVSFTAWTQSAPPENAPSTRQSLPNSGQTPNDVSENIESIADELTSLYGRLDELLTAAGISLDDSGKSLDSYVDGLSQYQAHQAEEAKRIKAEKEKTDKAVAVLTGLAIGEVVMIIVEGIIIYFMRPRS